MKYINYLAIAALVTCVHRSHASDMQKKTDLVDYVKKGSLYALLPAVITTTREIRKLKIPSHKQRSLLYASRFVPNYAAFTAIFGTATAIIDQYYTELFKK